MGSGTAQADLARRLNAPRRGPAANAAKNFTAAPRLMPAAQRAAAAARKNSRVKQMPPSATGAERRAGGDRRKTDGAPPSGWERRRGVEPRRPEVVELEMTPSQWDALHHDTPAPLAGVTSGKA